LAVVGELSGELTPGATTPTAVWCRQPHDLHPTAQMHPHPRVKSLSTGQQLLLF
jgi:hypothetical protein